VTAVPLASPRLHAPIGTRRSTRAFSTAPVDDETARLLLEAARWAPSAMNRQPWRFLVGRRGEPTHALLVDALAPGNRAWAADAGAVREAFGVPDEWRPTVVVAVGHPGDPGLLPADLAARESAPRVRLPIDEIAYATGWGRPCRDTDAVE
jgi:nitroreductase